MEQDVIIQYALVLFKCHKLTFCLALFLIPEKETELFFLVLYRCYLYFASNIFLWSIINITFIMFYYLIKDEVSGNWWTTHVRNFRKDIAIGYWPKELFDIIGHSVDMVGVTGVVQASPSGISPPMGNGHLPTKNEDESARVKHLLTVNSKFKIKERDINELVKLLDSNKCYGLRDGKKRFILIESNLFTYGGPGGTSC